MGTSIYGNPRIPTMGLGWVWLTTDRTRCESVVSKGVLNVDPPLKIAQYNNVSAGRSHAQEKVNHDLTARVCTFILDHCLLICCCSFTTYNSMSIHSPLTSGHFPFPCLPHPLLSTGFQVIYIDTEGTFRPDRVRQIAEAKGVAAEAAMDNIVCARCDLAEPGERRRTGEGWLFIAKMGLETVELWNCEGIEIVFFLGGGGVGG